MDSAVTKNHPSIHSVTMIAEPKAQDARFSSADQATFKRAKQRRWLVIGVTIAAVVFGAVFVLKHWLASSQSVSAASIRSAKVTRGLLVRDAAVNGKVVAAVSPTLFSATPATINLKTSAGSTVKKGDVLALLESLDLQDQLKREQAITEQLESEVSRQQIQARKQKLTARRDADQAEIERVTAQRAFDRVQAVGVGIVSKVDFLKAEDSLKSSDVRAKHALAASELEGQYVDLELKTRLSQLQNQRLILANVKRRVDELTLRAPVSGLVGSIAVADRTVVPANAPLMTLVDLSQLEVELEIPESYASDIGIGMRVELTIGAEKADGAISAISPEVIRNQVLARVRFGNTQPQGLRQSQRVSARILIDEKPNVLMLPRGSFLEHGAGRSAYVIEDSIASKRSIAVGATSVTSVEITQGLKEGDLVIVSGSENFEPTQRIAIRGE